LTQIFISYARDDDAAPPDLNRAGAKGFVTTLHEQLLYEFQELGQPRPKIWRDKRGIDPGDQFEPLIDEAIAGSSLLLVVLSRNWLTRPYCLRELESFASRWSKEGERALRQRLVVVAKHHVDPQKRPPLLQGQEGYLFFALDADAEAGQEHEFFARGAIRDPRYQERVRELGSYLWRSAVRLDNAAAPVPAVAVEDAQAPQPPMNGRTVYLAKPALDMRPAYNRLVDELQGRGYAVVPPSTQEIPNDGSATQFVDQALAAAELSVHLLGEKAGYAPEDAEPIVRLQLDRARARVPAEADGSEAFSRSFRRILWAPKVLEGATPSDAGTPARDPLAVLAKFDRQLATDKIEGDSLSKFVDFFFQHLDRTAPPREMLDAIKADARVYLYHRPEDTDYALCIAKALQQRDVEPVLPALEGDAAELTAFHRQNLVDCDAVVLCWASASEVWARVTSRELKNWRELGRESQFAYRGLVTGPPHNDRKKAYVQLPPRNEIDVVVDLMAYDTPSPEALDALVTGTRPKTP
jgi:TIR domain